MSNRREMLQHINLNDLRMMAKKLGIPPGRMKPKATLVGHMEGLPPTYIRLALDLLKKSKLKNVCGKLGLSKTGNKSDLVERLMRIFEQEEQQGGEGGQASGEGAPTGTTASQPGHSGSDLDELVLATHLDFRLHISVLDGARMSTLSCRCAEMPWVENQRGLLGQVDAGLASLSKGASGDARARGPKPELLVSRLEGLLESYLLIHEIHSPPRVKLTLEMHAPEALDPGLYEQHPEIEVIDYMAHLSANSRNLMATDLGLASGQVLRFGVADGGRGAALKCKSRKDFFLKEVALRLGEEVLASLERNQVVSAEQNTIPLPDLPVRDFERATRPDAPFQVLLTLQGGKVLALAGFKIQVPRLEKGPVALFVDMGSTYCKLIRVFLPPITGTQCAGKEEWSQQVRAALSGRIEHTDRKGITTFEPKPTTEFTGELGLPHYSKERLAGEPSETLASWIASAIECFARAWSQKHRAVAAVYWSFPEMDRQDLEEVSRRVEQLTRSILLDQARLISEHEALRNRFRGVLYRLATQAQEQKRKREDALAHNKKTIKRLKRDRNQYEKKLKEYNDTFALFRLFKTRPSRPDLYAHKEVEVPSLEEWHDRFVSINADRDLREVIILDAGGYTLDVFCRIGGHTLGKSFPAGSAELTDRLRTELSKGRGSGDGKISYREAEAEKKEECSGSGGSSRYAGLLKSWTEEIYTAPLDTVTSWVKEAGGKGIPVILTGGGMDNQFLVERVQQKFREQRISVLFTNAVILSQLIEEEALKDHSHLGRFHNITHGFQPSQWIPTVAYDVTGGLMEASLEHGRRP